MEFLFFKYLKKKKNFGGISDKKNCGGGGVWVSMTIKM
jgi:hypothetical protein